MALELAFAKKSLRTLCEDEIRARRDLGDELASALRRRLADMRAASCVRDLVTGRPRGLRSGRAGYMAVDLCNGYQLVFCVNHSAIPMQAGSIDWSRVKRIRIIGIESNHECGI